MMFRTITNHLKFSNKATLPSISAFGTSANASKKASPLAELRKKSGYSLSLCKKALGENEQNVDKAFKWLVVSVLLILMILFLRNHA